MRQSIFGMIMFAAVCCLGSAKPDKRMEVIYYDLDPGRVYPIYTYFDRGVTTIMFPGALDAIHAANVAMGGNVKTDTPNIDFIMDYEPGNFYFSIRAIAKGAIGSMNIVFGGQTYVLKLQEKESEAMSTVTFKKGRVSNNSAGARPALSPMVIKGLIDKAKAYDILKENYPADVAMVQFSSRQLTSKYDDFDAIIERTWRFNDYDTVVFMVTLKNRSLKTLHYVPRDTAIVVGENQYFASLIDASGVMPPRSTSVMFFAVTGSPDGGRNNLSINNDFKVLIFANEKKRVDNNVK